MEQNSMEAYQSIHIKSRAKRQVLLLSKVLCAICPFGLMERDCMLKVLIYNDDSTIQRSRMMIMKRTLR